MKIISNRLGFSFASPIVIVGAVMVVSGLLAVFENIFLGIVLLLIGGFIALSSYGVQINIAEKKIREYGSFYGVKYGRWVPLNNFSSISILSSRSGFQIYSRTNQSTSSVDDFFDVCVLNDSHRKKIVVRKFKSKSDASIYADQLSSALKYPVVSFNPVRSSKTSSRRR